MAMDLKLTTGNARSEIAQVMASLDSLRQKLDLVASAKGLDVLGQKLGSIRGVDPSVVAGINALNQTVQRIGQGSAAGITQLNTGLAQISQRLVQTNTLLTNAAGGARNFGGAANGANGGLNNFGGGVSRINGLLSVFGASLSIAGFVNFIQDSLKALEVTQKFEAQMVNLGGAKFAGAQLEYVAAVARETGQSLRGLTETYGKFGQSAMMSGLSVEDTAKTFMNASKSFRALGLSSEETKGAMKAMEQSFSKGKIQLEELTGQMGDRGVPAVNALAQSMGISKQRVYELAQAGQISAKEFVKMFEVLAEGTKGGFDKAMQSWSAAAANFDSALYKIQVRVGENFFGAFKTGLTSLSTAMDNVNVLGFIDKLATLAGWLASGLAMGFGAFLQFLGFINIGLNMLGAALTNVGAVFAYVGGVINGWTGGLFTSQAAINAMSAALSFMAPLLVLIVGGIVAWGATTAIIWGVQAAFATLNFVLGGTALASAATVGWWVAMAAAAIALGAAVLYISDSLGLTTGAFDSFVNKAQEAVASATALAKKLPGVTAEVGSMDGALGKAASSAGGFAKATNGAASAAAAALPIWGYTTEAVSKYKSETSQAASANDALMDKLAASYGSFGSVSSGASSAANSLDDLALSYAGVGRAAENANKVTTIFPNRVNDGQGPYSEISDSNDDNKYRLGGRTGKGTSGHTWDDWDIGGIIGTHSAKSGTMVPNSMWADAPHYAQGTSNTSLARGGMPAVVHPNEAIIPLSGGRNVPVEMRGSFGGGGGGGNDATVVAIVDLKQAVNVVNASVMANGVSAKTDADRLYERLSAIHQTLMLASRNGGTGDIYAPGGGSAGGGMGDFESAIKSFKTENADRYKGWKQGTGGTGIGYLDSTGRMRTSYEKSDDYTTNTGIMNDEQNAIFKLADQYGIEKVIREVLGSRADQGTMTGRTQGETLIEEYKRIQDASTGGSKLIGFAEGSPNASRDSGGGFLAMLHPDEAVIPLPDGRSVPVKMPTNMRDNDRGGGDTTFNVSVTINAKDAESFMKSKDQIAQEMQRTLDRAARNIGRTSDTEDPTRRTV